MSHGHWPTQPVTMGHWPKQSVMMSHWPKQPVTMRHWPKQPVTMSHWPKQPVTMSCWPKQLAWLAGAEATDHTEEPPADSASGDAELLAMTNDVAWAHNFGTSWRVE